MTDTRNGEDDGKLLYCSSCSKSQHEVRELIAGPLTFICGKCIDLCNGVIREEMQGAQAKSSGHKFPAPEEIHTILSQYVIEQERVKKVLAVAAYNHYKYLNQRDKKDDIELGKSSILVIDPTDSGRTLPAETLVCPLNIPSTIADATTLTEAGYVGEDVENIIQKLLQKCGYSVEKAQTDIVCIDEVNKISRKSDDPSVTRSVSGEGVQQALLKLIEDTIVSVPPQGDRKHPQQELLQIDMRSILLICDDAFAGLRRVVQNRFARGGISSNTEVRGREMGKKVDGTFKKVEPEDLVKFGLIPESAGCLSVIATPGELDKTALMQILTEPKNALIKQYAKSFEVEGIDLEFHPNVLGAVACGALERKTDAHGLHLVLEGILLDTMCEIPPQQDANKVVIGRNVIDGSSQPLMIYENSEKPTKAMPKV